MTTLLLILLLSVSLMSLIWKRVQGRPKGFPSGLPRLPLLGSIPFLVFRRSADPFLDLGDKGPIVGLFLGETPTIVVSDARLVREMLRQDVFSNRKFDRPLDDHMKDDLGGSRGLVFSNGAEWLEQRKFTVRSLREFGVGKADMNELIVEFSCKLIEKLKQKEGLVIDPSTSLNIAILGALWSAICGEILDLDDPRLADILKAMTGVRRSQGGLLDLLQFMNWPWLRSILNPRYDDFRVINEKIFELIDQSARRHQTNLDCDNPRDLMDAYLAHMQRCKDESSSFYGKKGEESLRASFLDLFVAGQETTASSVNWSLLHLLRNPEVLTRVQTEIEIELGLGATVNVEDAFRLPYTQAFLLESLRMASLAPSSIPHAIAQDVNFHGHSLPKGTLVVPNLVYIHHSAAYWSDPGCLRPERFLSSDQSRVVMNENLMAFGVGKRVCLGQSLAEKEHFVFLTNILSNFHLTPIKPLPSCEVGTTPTTSLARIPPSFQLVLRSRT